MTEDEQKTESAVNYVFTVLAATYGAAWDRSIGQAPIADVKTAWAYALDDFSHNTNAKKAIMWALRNLPDRVPNPREFKSLCRLAPQAAVALLEAPKADPERMRAELAKLGSLKQAIKPASGDRGEWCQRILQRQADGAKISPAVITMAKDGLQNLGLHSRVDNHKSLEENQL